MNSEHHHSRRGPLVARLITVTLWAAAAVLLFIAVSLPILRIAAGTAGATVNIPASTSQALLIDLGSLIPGSTAGSPTDSNLRLAPDDGDITITVIAGPTAAPDDATPRAPVWLSALSEAGTALWAAALGWGAFLLAGILGSTAAGEPFHPANPRRWSLLGIAILLASVGSDVINYAASNAFVNFYGVHDNLLVTSPYLSFVPPVIAFTAFLVAGAFAAGRRSQQELQGLV